jgi:hypothetical protein
MEMENADIHENICQHLDQPSSSAPKACKKQMVHREIKHLNFNSNNKEEAKILKCIDQ